MKKFYCTAFISLILTIAVLSVSCVYTNVPLTYDTMNEMAAMDYEKITLELLIEFGSKRLTGTYEISKQDQNVLVSYNYNQFTPFEIIDGELVAPENELENKSGSIVLQSDGTVVSQSGAEINLSTDIVTRTSLNFKDEYFENATFSDKGFFADVKDVKGFIGIENASNMKVAVKAVSKTEDNPKDIAFSEIMVSYLNAESNKVTLTFTFGK